LNSLEDAGVDLWLVPLGGTVNYPNVIAGTTQVITHLLETRPIKESGYSDKANNSRLAAGALIEKPSRLDLTWPNDRYSRAGVSTNPRDFSVAMPFITASEFALP
jgi:hypothetical protein